MFGVRTPAPALLALGQPYARNWRAIVDGAERPVGVANGAFVGVPVPAGETVVELRYASRAARAGMRLGVVTAWAIALSRQRLNSLNSLAVIGASISWASCVTAWQTSP